MVLSGPYLNLTTIYAHSSKPEQTRFLSHLGAWFTADREVTQGNIKLYSFSLIS